MCSVLLLQMLELHEWIYIVYREDGTKVEFGSYCAITPLEKIDETLTLILSNVYFGINY